MAQDAITVTGIEQYQEALRKMQTDNPATRRVLQGIIRRAIGEARKNVIQDAQDGNRRKCRDIKNQPIELLNSTA